MSYNEAIRNFMAEYGTPIKRTITSPYEGWENYKYIEHAGDPDYKGECSWVVPEGAVLVEESISEWGGTVDGSVSEMMVTVSGARCKCGKYTDVSLRYRGTLDEMLRKLFGMEGKVGIVL